MPCRFARLPVSKSYAATPNTFVANPQCDDHIILQLECFIASCCSMVCWWCRLAWDFELDTGQRHFGTSRIASALVAFSCSSALNVQLLQAWKSLQSAHKRNEMIHVGSALPPTSNQTAARSGVASEILHQSTWQSFDARESAGNWI